LQGACGYARRRVARQDDKATAHFEKYFTGLTGQIDNFARRAIAVRGVTVIAEIDEGLPRKTGQKCAKHREATMAGIEDTDHVRFALTASNGKTHTEP
jgi:hypothetical protein